MSFVSNITDPTIVKVLVHLNELINSNELPNYKLIQQAELKLRNDPSLYTDTNRINLIQSIFPKILEVIRSDNSTREAKNSSIMLLDSILIHFAFDQILTFFSLDQLLEALTKGNEELKVLAIKVIQNANPADLIANTPILVTFFQLLNDPETSVRLVSNIESCIVQLALGGELVRRRIQSNEIIKQMMEMRYNPKVSSRLFDLLVELLPVIPALPSELYLVPLDEFDKSDDILLDSLIISYYSKLIESISLKDTLKPLYDQLDEQIEYITRVYLDESFKVELKMFFNIESVIFLSKLSRLIPTKFEQFDRKYGVIQHACNNYQSDDSSLFLLANTNPNLLTGKSLLLKGLRINFKTLPIFANLIHNKSIFIEQLNLNSTDLLNLTTDTFLEFMSALTSEKYGVIKLINAWPDSVTRLLDEIKSVTNNDIWETKVKTLENLLKYKDELGVWTNKIQHEYSLMKNGKTIAPSVDVMDSSA